MNVTKPALAIALVGSLLMSETHMTFLPPSAQTPAQFVGGSYLPIEPDHTRHEAKAEDVVEPVVAATTISVNPLMMFSGTLKDRD
jgi:hypothetical protein